MSQSLTDDLRFNGKASAAAAGTCVEVDVYDPDTSVYEPDARNDKAAVLRSSIQSDKPPSMTLSVRASDGLREVLKLAPEETRAYLEGDLKARYTMKAHKIKEKRHDVARRAVEEMREKNLTADQLTPYAEVCLWERDLLEEKPERVPLREGGYSMPIVARLREDAQERLVREDPGVYGSDDYSSDGSGRNTGYLDQEFISFGGPMSQQLYLNDYWDMLAKCFWNWHHDPVAQEGVNIIRNFVLGRGMTVTAKDERVQAFIDAFDKDNGMKQRWKTWITGLSRDGNLFIRKIPQGDGTMKVRSLPANSIWEIITDAEDIEQIYYYAQRYQTRTQLFSPPDGDPQHWVERDLEADEIIHMKVNASDAEVFGRSDLFVILGYLKRLRDMSTTAVLKEQAQAAYVFDASIKGGKTDVDNFIATALPKGKPQPGSIFAHNEAATIQVLNSGKNSGSTGAGSNFEGLITMIAMGLGIAKDYLGVTSRGSRATALVATEPTAMRFEERQDTTGYKAKELYQDVIDEGRRYGYMAGVEDFSFTITFPEIQKDDAANKVDLINQGVGMQYLSHATAADMYATEVDIDDYDYDAELAQIEKEMQSTNPPLILSKYACVPMGDAGSGVAGAPFGDGSAPAQPQGALPGGTAQRALPAGKPASPSSATGAAQIRKDVGRQASVAEKWVGSYA